MYATQVVIQGQKITLQWETKKHADDYARKMQERGHEVKVWKLP